MYHSSYGDFSRLTTSTPQISIEPVDGTIELTALSRERRYQILHPDNHKHRYDTYPRATRASPVPLLSKMNTYLDTFLSVPLFNTRHSVSMIKESEHIDEQTQSKTLLRIGDSYHASLQLLGLQFGTDLFCEPSEVVNSNVVGGRGYSLSSTNLNNDSTVIREEVAFETLPRNSNAHRLIIVEKVDTGSPCLKDSGESNTKLERDGDGSDLTVSGSHSAVHQSSVTNTTLLSVSDAVKDGVDQNDSSNNNMSSEQSMSISSSSMSSFVLFSLRVGPVYVRYGTSSLYHEAIHSNRKIPLGSLQSSHSSRSNKGANDRTIGNRYPPVTLYLPEYNLELIFMGSYGGCGTLRLAMIILVNPVGCNRHMPDSYRAAIAVDKAVERENRANNDGSDVSGGSPYHKDGSCSSFGVYIPHHHRSLFASDRSLYLSTFARGCRSHCASGGISQMQRSPSLYSLCSESAFLITDTLRHVFGNPTQEQFLTQYKFSSPMMSSRPAKKEHAVIEKNGNDDHDHPSTAAVSPRFPGTFEWYTMDYDFEKMGCRSSSLQSKSSSAQSWAGSPGTSDSYSYGHDGSGTSSPSIPIGAVLEGAASIGSPSYLRFFCKIPHDDAQKMRMPAIDDSCSSANNRNTSGQTAQLFSDRKSVDVLPSTSVSIRAAMVVMMSKELAAKEDIPINDTAVSAMRTQGTHGMGTASACSSRLHGADGFTDINSKPNNSNHSDTKRDTRELSPNPNNFVFHHQRAEDDKEYTLHLLETLSSRTMGVRQALTTNCYVNDESATNDAQEWILLPGIGATLVPSGHSLKIQETTPQDAVELFGTPIAVVSDQARGRVQYDPLVAMKGNNCYNNEGSLSNRKADLYDDDTGGEGAQSRDHFLFDSHKANHMEEEDSRYCYNAKDTVRFAADHPKKCSSVKHTTDEDCQYQYPPDDAFTYLYPKVGVDLVFAGLPCKLTRIVVHNPIPLTESQFCGRTVNATPITNSATATTARCPTRGTSNTWRGGHKQTDGLLHFTNSIAIVSTSAAYKKPYFSALLAPPLMSTPLIGWNPNYKQCSRELPSEGAEERHIEVLTPLTNSSTYGSIKASMLKSTTDLLEKQGTPLEKILFLLNHSEPLLVPEFTGYHRAYNGEGVDRGAAGRVHYATARVPFDGVSLHLIASKPTTTSPRSSGVHHVVDDVYLVNRVHSKHGTQFDDAYISKIIITASIKPEGMHRAGASVPMRGGHQDAWTESRITNPAGPSSNLIEMLLLPLVSNVEESPLTTRNYNETSPISTAPVYQWYRILAPYISPTSGGPFHLKEIKDDSHLALSIDESPVCSPQDMQEYSLW